MLSPSVQLFLQTLNWVCELEEADARLEDAGRKLFVQLVETNHADSSADLDQLQDRIGRIRGLRTDIARELHRLAERADLRLLGRRSGPA